MYIIAIETHPSSCMGGKHLSMFEVCRGLSDRGHKIVLIYFNEGDLLPEYRKFCQQVIYLKNWRIERQKLISSTLKFVKSVWQSVQICQIPKNEPALVYTDNYLCALFADGFAKLKKLVSVFHIRLGLSSQIVFHKQDKLAIEQIDRYITISQKTRQEWMEKFNIPAKKINVIYNGTDIQKFKPAIQQHTPADFSGNRQNPNKMVSYIGRLDREKGIETLMIAFSLLVKDTNRDLKLAIAGIPLGHKTVEAGKKYEQSLKQLPKELGIEDRVEFLGHVADTVSIYQNSDVTVLPSIYPEPFGRTIIESMACGIPVIASRIGGIPEILTGEFAVGLFQPGDEKELAAKLNEFIDWKENNPQLGERCRKHIISNFKLDLTLDNLEKLLIDFSKPKNR